MKICIASESVGRSDPKPRDFSTLIRKPTKGVITCKIIKTEQYRFPKWLEGYNGRMKEVGAESKPR